MDGFYAGIIFAGIILVIISLIWIAYDRKKTFDHSKQFDAKKEEILGIIDDAEMMISELNKFSDYIVTQMDKKNEELCLNLKIFDEKIKFINKKKNPS